MSAGQRCLKMLQQHGEWALRLMMTLVRNVVPGSSVLEGIADLAGELERITEQRWREHLLQLVRNNHEELQRLGAALDLLANRVITLKRRRSGSDDDHQSWDQAVRRWISQSPRGQKFAADLQSLLTGMITIQGQNYRLLDGQQEILLLLRQMAGKPEPVAPPEATGAGITHDTLTVADSQCWAAWAHRQILKRLHVGDIRGAARLCDSWPEQLRHLRSQSFARHVQETWGLMQELGARLNVELKCAAEETSTQESPPGCLGIGSNGAASVSPPLVPQPWFEPLLELTFHCAHLIPRLVDCTSQKQRWQWPPRCSWVYLSQTLITQEQYALLMGENPSWFSRTGRGRNTVEHLDDGTLSCLPVESVSWNDAQNFVERLNRWFPPSPGYRYGLPAALHWTSAIPVLLGKPGTGNFCYGEQPTPVGSFPPEPFGFFDLVGSVAEWNQELHHNDSSLRTAQIVTRLPDGRGRIVETGLHPDRAGPDLGFRLALIPTGEQTFANAAPV